MSKRRITTNPLNMNPIQANPPTPQSTRRGGHQNTIYLSGTADGSLDFDGTADGNAEGLSD
jgi:hypothetical protein